jgi:hypothetical protein
MLDLGMIVYHIVEMYEKTILINGGNFDEGLPAQKKSTHNIDSSYVLCEYVNVDEEQFFKWLALNETLGRCMHVLLNCLFFS